MAQLWVKSSADGEVQGPFTAIELRGLAAAGHVPRDAPISVDQTHWRAAEQVKGLFPAYAPEMPGDEAVEGAQVLAADAVAADAEAQAEEDAEAAAQARGESLG